MWKRATVHLTLKYTALFLVFIWFFSGGLYLWVSKSLDQDYVERVLSQVEQTGNIESTGAREDAARVAADVAVERFGEILVIVNGIATLLIPFGAYFITRRTLRPLIVAQEQQKQFVADASHELRTPLAILNGELELALNKVRSGGSYRTTLSASKAEVERMIQLTNQLLMLNKIDNNQTAERPPMETINLSDSLQVVVERHRTLAESRRIELVIDMTAESAPTFGNSQLIETALANVIQNAVKYSPHGGKVAIVLKGGVNRMLNVVVENVSDQLNESDADKIFDRFYQSRHRANDQGFGLGLAITKSIMELHQGAVNAKVAGGKIRLTLSFRAA